VRKWRELCTAKYTDVRPHIAESLPPGVVGGWGGCNYGIWRGLNRLRVGVGRCGEDMVRWGYGGDERSGCGELQTRDHFRVCGQNPVLWDRLDLVNATWKAVAVASHWSGRI